MKKVLFIFSLIIVHLSLNIDKCMCQWYQINLPVSGQINDIQFINQNTGWAVVKQSNYIYTLIRTTNQGTNWNVIYSDSSKVWFIHFFNDTLGYSLGYVYGTHLISKTTNKGYNWNIIQQSGSYVFTKFYFLNPDTGWVAGVLSGLPDQNCILKTSNGMQNLDLIYITPGSGVSNNLKFFYSQSSGQYIGYNLNDGFLERTTNSGYNWQQINIGVGTTYGFSFINKDTGWINIDFDYSKIYKTLNGGQNWILQYYDSNNNRLSQVFAINSRYIWCGTSYWNNRIFVSTDGGSNWGFQYSQIHSPSQIYLFDSLLGFAWNPSQIERTINGGGPITSIEKTNSIVSSNYLLKQNFPNPFNSETNIEFSIPSKSIISLKVYDILGREVITLLKFEELSSGEYRYKLNFGRQILPSGVYYYRLNAYGKTTKTEFSSTKKLIYNK